MRGYYTSAARSCYQAPLLRVSRRSKDTSWWIASSSRVLNTPRWTAVNHFGFSLSTRNRGSSHSLFAGRKRQARWRGAGGVPRPRRPGGPSRRRHPAASRGSHVVGIIDESKIMLPRVAGLGEVSRKGPAADSSLMHAKALPYCAASWAVFPFEIRASGRLLDRLRPRRCASCGTAGSSNDASAQASW